MTDEVRSLDLVPSTAPALSTTSDMPNVKAEPEAKETKEVKVEPKADEGKTDAKVDAKPDAKTDEVKDDPKEDVKAEDDKSKDVTPAWQKREITKARNRQREAEERATTLESRLDKALGAIEKLSTKPAEKADEKSVDPRPDRKSYDDPDKYESDLVSWSARTAAKVTQAEIEKQGKEREANEAKEKSEKADSERREKVASAWQKSHAKALETYPDYTDVAENPDIQITPDMAHAMLRVNKKSGNGPDIAYHLGKNPEEAARIAALDIDDQLVEIAELGARLKAKPAPVSKVPEPPKPLGSKSSAGKKSGDDESMEEYAARRNASLRPQRANPH